MLNTLSHSRRLYQIETRLHMQREVKRAVDDEVLEPLPFEVAFHDRKARLNRVGVGRVGNIPQRCHVELLKASFRVFAFVHRQIVHENCEPNAPIPPL